MSVILVALLAGEAVTLAGALAPLQPYVGQCWVTEMAPGLRDRHCFEAVYGGAHVRDRHSVTRDGSEVYAGETLYSDAGGSLVFVYLNSLGGSGQGRATPEGDGALSFRMEMRARPAEAPRAYLTRWQAVDGGYTAETDGEVQRFRRD